MADTLETLTYRMDSVEHEVGALKAERLTTAVAILQVEQAGLKSTMQTQQAEIALLKSRSDSSKGVWSSVKFTVGVGFVVVLMLAGVVLQAAQIFGGH